jgi:hypothetical protein
MKSTQPKKREPLPSNGNVRIDPHKPHAPAAAPSSSLLASILGFGAAAVIGGGIVWSSGCRGGSPPGDTQDRPSRTSSLPAPSATTTSSASAKSAPSGSSSEKVASEPSPSGSASADKPYTGPMLGALGITTLIYPTPEFTKKPGPIGYMRLGSKAPVDPAPPIKNASCEKGWYHLVDGGYVCGKYATLDVNSSQVKLGITAPALEELLPYKYAYNNADGTPLYRSVPSKEDMLKYEPYLEAAKKAKRKKEEEASADDAAATAVPSDDDKAVAANILDGGAPEEPQKAWWDHEPGTKSPSVKLADLESESDATMAKRMVKGFFLAIDKQFAWNGRLWYKTTGGLVAPSDRMYLVKAQPTQGLEFPEGAKQVGFITSAKASKWEYDPDKKSVTAKGTLPKFSGFGLTGVTVQVSGATFRQTNEGWYTKAGDGTVTEPGPPPPDLAQGEKWIDVNLSRKTLVAFDGDKPYYAALVSPGKKSKNKEKNHETIKGTFRIREKHIAVTMDGDGRSASDLPYSIEDVPFVEYFEGSYALHAAFWHNNFGHEMSHGCVNLSPLDAKKIFFWSEPKLPRGWHAVWSTPEHKGTIVVVHD